MPTFSSATFRTVGNAATSQNLFAIFNSGANRVVRVRRLVMQMDATAALTAVMPIIKTSRIVSAPTAIAAVKVAWDTTASSHADILVRQTASSDGGALTAITGSTIGDVVWQQYGMRLHTAVGQVLGIDNNVLSAITETYPVVLRQNEGLIVHIVAAATTSNPATNHYFVQCAWDEDAV
jgi:hypothetical protein